MRLALALVALAVLVPFAAVGGQAEESEQVRVVAHDDASHCVADRAPCYEIVGDWSLVEAGSQLPVVFENNASSEHALDVAAGANASDDRDTNRSAAFAEIGPVAPGAEKRATIEIPSGTDTAYLFCHVDDHERQGLHLLRNVYPAGSVEEARETGPGLDDPNESSIGLGLALAAVAAAGLAGRRIRR